MSEPGSPQKKINRIATKSIKFDSPRCRTSYCKCEIIEKQIDDIKASMQQQFGVLQGQLKIAVEALAEQKVLISQLLRQHSEDLSLQSIFPVTSEQKLTELNQMITRDNKDIYIKAMKSILQPGGIDKNLKKVLATEIVTAFNIDGVHEKKRLKSFENFYSALLDSITFKEDNTAENQLRRAIQLQKKRFFKAKSARKESNPT